MVRWIALAAWVALQAASQERGDGDGKGNAVQGVTGGNPFLWNLKTEHISPETRENFDRKYGKLGHGVSKKIEQDINGNFPAGQIPSSQDLDLAAQVSKVTPIQQGTGGEARSVTTGFGGGVRDGMSLRPPELDTNRQFAENLAAQYPGEPHIAATLAIHDQASGNNKAALAGFETAIAGGENGSRILTYASLAALNAGDPRKAAAWAAEALQKDPDGPMAEQAEAISKMALKRLPKEEDPFKNPPPTRASHGDERGSIPELERPLPAKAAEPGLPPEVAAVVAETNRLVALASKAYRAGDIKEAEKLASETLAKDPDDVRALQVRAAAEAKEGRWEEARKDADRGLDLAPGYVPLLLLRAAAAAHAKDWRAVKADSETVIKKERTNPTAWRFMGLAQAGVGARADAAAALARAAQYGDAEAARLLAVARSLPAGSDAVDLMSLLSGPADETAAAAAPAAPAPRRNRFAMVLGAALFAGVVAGGMILLVGRRDSESA